MEDTSKTQDSSVPVAQAEKQIAVLGNGTGILIPVLVQTVLNARNALMKCTKYLALKGGLTEAQAKGKKLKELKALIGPEKAKRIIAEFNTAKGAFHVWSAKTGLLVAADTTQRKSVRVVVNKAGVVSGFDMKSRFVNDPLANAQALQIAEFTATIAELRAAAKAALPAS